MRDYGKVSPRFWTGPTGKQIRALGLEAQLVALYLMTAPGSSMSGLYYLPLPTLAHETGIPIEGASKALRSLRKVGFAHYDEAQELVWVPEMASHQLGPTLDRRDKRHTGLLRELAQYRKCRFIEEFWQRYREAYQLPQTSPFEAPSKPLRSQEQEQEQEQEQDTSPPSGDGAPSADPPPPPSPRQPGGVAAPRAVRDVFEHWQRVMDSPRSVLDTKRARAIAAALARHGADDCRRAIDGCHASDWHMNRPGAGNERGKRFNDVELILRDAKHVDEFLALAARASAEPAAAAPDDGAFRPFRPHPALRLAPPKAAAPPPRGDDLFADVTADLIGGSRG